MSQEAAYSFITGLCNKPKKLCCVCNQALAGYSWSEHRHPKFKSKKFRVHMGDCRKILFEGKL